MLLPTMNRKRGNPNWGKPGPLPRAGATEFEMQVHRLGLTRETLVHSTELRKWCEHHKNRCYIPESLLKSWGLEVDALSYTLSRSFLSVLRSHFFGTLKHARDPWPGPPTNPLERPVDRPSKQAWQSPEPQPRR